ncbi:hypothetical protein C7212DRAFT_196476, partial [Tuber magnatum]
FFPVTSDQLPNIDQIRNTQQKGLRFIYLDHKQVLVIKIMISSTHEIVNKTFTTLILKKAIQMGIDHNFAYMGSTTLTAPGGRNEGDFTFRPVDFRPYKTSWPTLVVECGVSRSLARLVVDPRWWLEN